MTVEPEVENIPKSEKVRNRERGRVTENYLDPKTASSGGVTKWSFSRIYGNPYVGNPCIRLESYPREPVNPKKQELAFLL